MERLACCIPVLTLILRIHELQFRPHARPGVGECVFSPKCELGPESLEGKDGVWGGRIRGGWDILFLPADDL